MDLLLQLKIYFIFIYGWVALGRFRNAQENQIKVKIRRNKNKIEKDNESLNAVKKEMEIMKKEKLN